MKSELVLSVVDQSPVRRGGAAAEALGESVKLAQAVERLGYARYWVAEHHNTGSFSGAAPEILIGQIGAATSRIRVGSGGVMLTHYASLKVAEQFRMLDSFFPGRIDLGIGRAPGSDQYTAAALADPRPMADVRAFPRQVGDLLGFLHGFDDPDHRFRSIRPQPGPDRGTAPEVWLLGSSDYSARLAASLGLPFSYADFFGFTGDHGPFIAELYRDEFKPSRFCAEPRLNVTVQLLCAPTREEAVFLGSSRNLMRAARYLNLKLEPGLYPPEEASTFEFTPQQMAYISGRSGPQPIDGGPEDVHARLMEAAASYNTNDIGIVTNCYHFEDRVRSYELIAQACGLESRADEDLGAAPALVGRTN